MLLFHVGSSSDVPRATPAVLFLVYENHLDVIIEILRGACLRLGRASAFFIIFLFQLAGIGFREFIAISIVATIFEPEGPLEPREWHVPERRRKHSEKLISAEYSIQVVAGLGEAQFDKLSIFVEIRPELNRCLSIESEHPVPPSEACHDYT